MSDGPGSDFQTGITALRDGRMAEADAAFRRALEAEPNHPATLYNLGLIAYHEGKSQDAEPLLVKALSQRSGHADTQALLAVVQADLGKLDAAVRMAQTLLENQSADGSTLNAAGQIFAAVGDFSKAELAYRTAVESDKAYRPAGLALINLLIAQRKFEEALAVCDQHLDHRPTDQVIHLKRTQALWDNGDTQAAWEALGNLLDFAPDHVTAHYNLSLFANPPDPDTSIKRLCAHLSESNLESEDRIKAWFALGNLFASKQMPEISLAAFAQANDERIQSAPATHSYSTAAFERRVEELLESPLPTVPAQTSPSRPTPIVISGPSRAGKSLLQAWLSGHPDIAAADETGALPALAERDGPSDPEQLKEAAEAYLSSLRQLGGDARYVIDTHPINGLYLDLLLSICPDAKIIQITRNPLDLAVSIFARHFVTGGHWADTWSGIASRIKAYEALADHWQAWSPVIGTLQYETLVADPKSVLGPILDALSLPWDDSVLPPVVDGSSQSLTPMPWASFADRPPCNQNSIGLWKPFAPWLGAFADAYGRASLDGDGLIPAEVLHPSADLIEGLRSLHDQKTPSGKTLAAVESLPAVHRLRAAAAVRDGRFADAVEDHWAAVSCRPFTHHVRTYVEGLKQTLKQSPDHQDLALLHDDIDRFWQDYQKSCGLRFGDFGLPYQSFARLYIPGSRDTAARLQTYELDGVTPNAQILDIGCNLGFLTLSLAENAKSVLGVDTDPTLIRIAERVRDHLAVKNCTFQVGDGLSVEAEQPFDVVIAAAVHGWLDVTTAEFCQRISSLTAPGGTVLLESQGQRSTIYVEEKFTDYISTFCENGFEVVREGQLCDDRVNLRAFALLRKNS